MRRLAPTGAELDAAGWLAELDLAGERVVAIMVGSADGHASVDGRSEPLSSDEDRALLRINRAAADALVVGTNTLRGAGYGTDMLDPEQRAARVAAGRPPFPLVATATRSGKVPWSAPIFASSEIEILVFGDGLDVPDGLANTTVLPFADWAGVLTELRRRGLARVVSEGGPSVLRALIADGLVDDLLLTLAPKLVAGEDTSVLAGPLLEPVASLALKDAARGGEHLFLHYARYG